MAVLTHIEQCVWHAYNSHADDTGIAWVGPSTIAKYAGHASASHIRRARVQLVANGLLVRVDGGGGRVAGKFRVEAPKEVPDTLRGIGARSESALGPKPPMHPTPNRSRQPAPNPPMHPAPNRRTEVPMELPTQVNNNNSAAVVDGLVEEGGREDKAMSAMRRYGIVGKTPKIIVDEVPGITAGIVESLASTLSRGAGTGVLVNTLKADGPRMVKEAEKQRTIVTDVLPRLKQQHADAMEKVRVLEQEQRDLLVKASQLTEAWVLSLDDDTIEAMLKKEAKQNRTITPQINATFVKRFGAGVQGFCVDWWKREKPEEALPLKERNEELKKLIPRSCLEAANLSSEIGRIRMSTESDVIGRAMPNERGFVSKSIEELEDILPKIYPTPSQAAEFWKQNYTPTAAEVDERIKPNRIQDETN